MANRAFGYINDVSLGFLSGGGVGFKFIAIDSSGANVLPGGASSGNVEPSFSYSDTPQSIWATIVSAVRVYMSDPSIEVVCLPGSFDQFVLDRSY